MNIKPKLKETLQHSKPYLFWRGDIDDLETLLEQSIALQDKSIIDQILHHYDYTTLQGIMINTLYHTHNTLFAKRNYDRVFNYIIHQTYHTNIPASWML